MYDVGFGDCFLLSFVYASGNPRRVLIDCGSRNAENKIPPVVDQLMTDLADTEGHVDAVVITHRHLDHLSGFGDPQAAPKLATLSPQLVLQPWTEDPNLAHDAQDENGEHVQTLEAAQQYAQTVAADAKAALPTASAADQQMVAYLASLGIKNPAAVTLLSDLGDERKYLSFNQESGLGALLPGVTVTVLGPPTLTESSDIKSESSTNSTQFWQLQRGLMSAFTAPGGTGAGADPLFPNAKTEPLDDASPCLRWAIQNLNGIQDDNVERFVQCLDTAMNNTSLILLFEVGDKVLLFPGDAQWENWHYGLQQDGVKDRLANVDLYKVGHHGSCNATPMDLWNLFQRRNAAAGAPKMTTLLPTALGPFKTVPKDSLVTALTKETDMIRSDQLGDGVLSYTAVVNI